jgi:hypothetical protein
MAKKKNDNTLLWLAAGGIGLYFLWKNVSVPADNTATTVLPAQPAPAPVLMIPQSATTQNAIPAGVSNMNLNTSTSPVNITDLTPVPVAANGTVATTAPIAVNSQGQMITTNDGVPLMFSPVSYGTGFTKNQTNSHGVAIPPSMNGYEDEGCDL